jgi:hypothetical protein
MISWRVIGPMLFALGSTSLACAGDSSPRTGEDEPEVLDRDADRGRARVHFPVATKGAPDEICVLPRRLPGADYKASDEKGEQELCSYSFYGTPPREQGAPMKEVAICPKLTSTNPGTDLEELLAGKSREETEAAVCALRERPTKKLAKYKQSITCSYTPSILGYYHLSRALGGVGDVKPAVVRTMDLAEHKALVGEALTALAAEADESYPKTSWLRFRAAEEAPGASRHLDAIFTRDLLQIYGGLQDNVRGEEKYTEINKKGPSEDPSSFFVQTAAYRRVVDPRPVSQMIGRSLADAAQPLVQMRDITEMLLVDYLMSQQDRFGNIHAILYYYFPKPEGGFDKVKKSKVDDGEVPLPTDAVLVKKMVLKDNDCGGPTKKNVVKTAGLLEQLRHMNPGTYRHLRWLDASFGRGGEIPNLLVSEALFAQRDLDMLRVNLHEAAEKAHAACVAGKLLLDLDLEGHLAGGGHDPGACEASEPPTAP